MSAVPSSNPGKTTRPASGPNAPPVHSSGPLTCDACQMENIQPADREPEAHALKEIPTDVQANWQPELFSGQIPIGQEHTCEENADGNKNFGLGIWICQVGDTEPERGEQNTPNRISVHQR